MGLFSSCATPAGHAVYVQEGFVDTWSFARHRREAGPLPAAPPAGPSLRPLREALPRGVSRS